MSEYFKQLEQQLGDAVETRRHRSWRARLRPRRPGPGPGPGSGPGRARSRGRSRALIVIVAGLVVAAPAVAAVSGLFKTGTPDQYPQVSASAGLGPALPNGAKLLPIRISDPGGGPAWGMRLVKTSRGNTCVQVGRVQNGQLGSLGIYGAWHNDDRFHVITSNDFVADICGSTDAAGYGFANQTADAEEASANATVGSDEAACNPASSVSRRQQRIRKLEALHPKRGTGQWLILHALLNGSVSLAPICPAAGERLIMAGLLGPDAVSVTYRTAAGTLATEHTVGGVGAYLIVERSTSMACSEYGGTVLGPLQGCDDGDSGGGSVPFNGVITKITYTQGRSCRVAPPAMLAAALRTYETKVGQLSGSATAARLLLAKQFRATMHMNVGSAWEKLPPRCPMIGFVKSKTSVTEAQVSSPVRFEILDRKRSCYPPTPAAPRIIACKLVKVSFIAREPVTSSHSWYQVQIVTPRDGGAGSGNGADVRAGQRLHFTIELAVQLAGRYRGTVVYEPNSGAAGIRYSPGRFNQHGTLVVGRFNFNVSKTGKVSEPG